MTAVHDLDSTRPRPGTGRALYLGAPLLAEARAACAAVIERSVQRGRVRVWVPGCKTGGTAHLVAMLLSEAAQRVAPSLKLLVFATDSDEDALAIARKGRYPARAALGMDPALRANYSFDDGVTIRISEATREKCVFSRHELGRDLPMARMDLIVCQRTFDGLSSVRRAELVHAFHYSLRLGGVLLALDHAQDFACEQFEPAGAAWFRAREGWSARRRSGVVPGGGSIVSVEIPPAPKLPVLETQAGESPGHDVGLPLLVCDQHLRVLLVNLDARLTFGLAQLREGTDLTLVASGLPGGLDVVRGARRALASRVCQEITIRAAERHYLVRAAPGSGTPPRNVSLAFTDVTALEAAKAEAVAQRHQHAALARVSELALRFQDPAQLYEEALGGLFGNIPICSAGVIVECGPSESFRVVASRGLGENPVATLREPGDAFELLRTAAGQGQAPRNAQLGPARRPGQPGWRRAVSSQPVHAQLSALAGGMACPILSDGVLLGVVALFSRRISIDQAMNRHFLHAMANVLGGALGRHRTRQALAMELEASIALARTNDVGGVATALAAVLRGPLDVESVELWAATTSPRRWSRISPGGPSPDQPWPAKALGTSRARGAFEVWVGGTRECLVPIPSGQAAPAVLRLCGARLPACEDELGQALPRIAQRVADFLERQRTISELRRVEASLREADRQKDDFLALLGHELRNPIAAIRNATELLRQVEPRSPQLTRLHGIFERQTQQTTQLIDGLLDVARVAHGKVTLQLAPVHIAELLRQVVEDRRQQFARRVLELDLPDVPLWALADRVRFVQIVDNLLSNALKFTADGGRVSVRLAHDGQRGLLRVDDDGIGIEPELLPEIFQPFRQGDGQSSLSQGLGLGLALVQGLVQLHGFQLQAHSAGPGRGASFQLAFPLAEPGEESVSPSRLADASLSLLLVEDNPDIAETLTELLTAVGHAVRTVPSAESALESLSGEQPNALLCDIGLPGMDGMELARRLRADPRYQGLKLVAMTGFGDASTQAKIQAAGFDRQLIKPVELQALRECLARVAPLNRP